MKFTLTQDTHFAVIQHPGQRSLHNQVLTFLVELPLDGIPKEQGNILETDLWKELQRVALVDDGRGQGCLAPWGLLHCEIFALRHCWDMTSFSLRIVSGPVTNALVELFGNNVRIQVIFSQFNYINADGKEKTRTKIRSSQMELTKDRYYACEDADIVTTPCLGRYGVNSRNFKGRVTIMVHVPETIVTNPTTSFFAGPELKSAMLVQKKMLEEGIGSDVVIITGEGIRIKSHTCMLSAYSDVFRAMFESDMKEARTHMVRMRDISEEGVRALLGYLYCCEATEPKSKPGVALEMLTAGHKYAIEELKTAMKKLLLAKLNTWFDVDVATKLFLFANKLPGDNGKKLKKKAVGALKMNLGYLKKSPTSALAELFKEDPESALELCQCLCTV